MRWQASFSALALSMTAQAGAQVDRSALPIPPAPFKGQIRENVEDSTPDFSRPVRAPEGAPNMFVMMSDDVGFAMSSAFGGPVPTPNFQRMADRGSRYNRFHTTGICSPSRAALLTGRNHHNAGAGYLTDTTTGYPAYEGRIPYETATIAQILRLNGYNTAMFGKHHNVPSGEDSANGPFDRWPTGLGFEYFLGYVGPETDQFRANLYRGTNMLPGDDRMELLDARLADDAIDWLHNQQAPGSGKPFFIYFSPSSTHEPHQAPADVIARFKGMFDQGWDHMRVETWRRQIAMGIIPPDTKLTERPEGIPAWDSLSPAKKAIAARSMEVAAAMLAYQDAQLGRIFDEIERMGKMDNTVVALIIGDNGASADQGVEGAFNRVAGTNRIPESTEWKLAHLDELGSPNSYANYQAGWSFAMNTPLRWTKQFGSMLGGIRNGMILSWPGHVAKPGKVCGAFGHLVDIAPTLLDAAGLPVPDSVYGAKQKPMDGQSLLPSLKACNPTRSRTQYFEIGGKLGLWQDGWFASNDDGRKPWEGVLTEGSRPPTHWTLYNLDKDFSQSTDLSAKEPERLRAMIAHWQQEAERNHVYPLDHSFGSGRRMAQPPKPSHYVFWGKNVSMPTGSGPNFVGKSFTIDAQIVLPTDHASGVVLAQGSRFAGWSLLLEKGKPTFVYARTQEADQTTRITAASGLPSGKVRLRLIYRTEGIGKPADIIVMNGETQVAAGQVPATFFVPGGAGEMLDSGRDTGVPVTDYTTLQGQMEGDIIRIDLDMK